MDITDYSGRLREPIAFQWADKITDEAALGGAEEIVEDVLTAGSTSVWYGESHSGKTTLLLDLSFRMTAGETWLGKRTVKGVVIYCALEGRSSVQRRLMAFRRHHGRTVYNFGLVSSSLNLMDPSADVEDLIELIQAKMTEFGPTEPPLRLIVVDTLARAMGGANENASEDMARLIAAGDRIREVCGAHVAFVHHSGKDASKGARGHSSLKAAVDAEIEVTADEATKLHTVCIEKQRELGTKGMKLSATFKVVELGRNARWPDKPITACIVEPYEEPTGYVAAILKEQDQKHANRTVLDGFKRLQEMGVKATDGNTSRDFLPRQILDKGLGDGLTREELTQAMHRLMTEGVLSRGVIGRYGNGSTEKFGLVLREG